MPTRVRPAVQIPDARAVLHVLRVLVAFVQETADVAPALSGLEELVHAERKTLEVGDDLAVVDEWRGGALPQYLPGVQRIRIGEEIIDDLCPTHAGTEDVHAENLALGEAIPHRKREVLAIGMPVGRAHRSEEHTSELQSPCNLVC